MKTKIDIRRLVGLALVAAAIALYVRDCSRRQTEQTALLAVRAAASDPGALVAFYAPDPANPGARLFRPVRDAAVASNVVAALAATEPGWKLDHPVSSFIAEHDVLLLGADRRGAFFHLRRSDGDSRVCVQLAPGPQALGFRADAPLLSAAGLDGILKRVEAGELLDDKAAIRIVDTRDAVAFTNVWPVAAEDDPAGALRAAAAKPFVRAELAPVADGAPSAPFRALEPAAASNLVAALASAEPVAFPDGTREGDLWHLRLFAGGRELYILRAAVLEERPADAFVGFLLEPAPGSDAEPRLSAPALVPGLGSFLKSH